LTEFQAKPKPAPTPSKKRKRNETEGETQEAEKGRNRTKMKHFLRMDEEQVPPYNYFLSGINNSGEKSFLI